MLEYAVSLSQEVQGVKCGSMWQHWLWEGIMSLAQAAGVHSIDSSVDLAEHCLGSAVAARAVSVLSGAPGTRTGTLVVRAGGKHTAAWASCRLYVGAGARCRHT